MTGFIMRFNISSLPVSITHNLILIFLAHWLHAASQTGMPTTPELDLREEYANAFRTESYNEFWTCVLALNNGDFATCNLLGSTSASRLPSYRFFAEHLLDPNQHMVNRILIMSQSKPEHHFLLSDYFTKTADASILCGLLLKDIDHLRTKYRPLKTIIGSIETFPFSSVNPLPILLTRLTELTNSNPFVTSPSAPLRFQALQAGCYELLKGLESSRDKILSKLRQIKKVKRGSAIILVVLSAPITVIVATHAIALLVVAPAFITASLELGSTKKMVKLSTQLDAAVKGTYILNRDLDTVSRLAARLNDELEHMQTMGRFWMKGGDHRLQASGEVARQLKKSDVSFSEQLDEMEEHLYLCFLTINRSRKLVAKEILGPA